MPETPAQVMQRHEQVLRDLRAGTTTAPATATATATITPAATTWSADPSGPTMPVLVGPSGRLNVVATARLTPPAGGQVLMGWTITGPYMDAETTETFEDVPVTTVAASDQRALLASSDIAASYRWQHTNLAPGWYMITAAYRRTASTGTASGRQLTATPT